MRFCFSITSCMNVSTRTDLLFSLFFIAFYRFLRDSLLFFGVRPVPLPIERSKILLSRVG
jgi:hypothetical protein